MSFFKKVSQSVYSPSFYSEIVKGKTGSPTGYLALLSLILAVFFSLAFIKPLFVQFPSATKDIAQKIGDYFPEDLVIKIKEGEVSVNKPEPYFLPLPFDFGKMGSEEELENLMVIDTKTSFSFEQFAEYSSFAWLTKNNIATLDGRGRQAKLVSLAGAKNVVIDRPAVDKVMEKLGPVIGSISSYGGPVLFILAFIFIFLGNFLMNLLYLVLFALVIWVVGKFFGLAHTYGQSYKIGIYALTLGLIFKTLITVISFWTPLNVSTPTYLVSAITLAVVIANFMGMKKLGGHNVVA